MAAGTSTPQEAGQGPSVLNIAASIGAKIRDAAEDAKEQREKAAEKGETPKKGSLFKSSLANQFNPIKSKKAKSNWAKQFDWNKKSDSDQQVKPPTGGDGGGEGKAKLKEFIAGGFTAILKDTSLMVSKLDGVKSLAGENLGEVTRASSTLTVIKDSIDAQTELRRKALEEAKFARAEKKLEKTTDSAGVSGPTEVDPANDAEGGGGGGGGGGLFDMLLGGLEGVESFMQIRNLLGAGKGAGNAAGIGGAGAAAIVGGVGLAMSAGGEGMFQLGKMGDQSLKDRRKSIDEKKARGENTFLDEALQVGQTGVGEIGKTLGVAMDVGGAPFRYAIEALRNPFLSPEQKEEQAYNLAKMDTRIREHSRGWMNRIDFMNVIPDQKGGFGNIYGNESATKEMAGKMSEGGIVPSAVPLSKGGLAPGLYDNPTKGMLSPGQSVIPLNRSEGKEMFGKSAATNPGDTAIDTVGAMILGVSAGMLGKTDSGTVGDQVKQNIRKASKEFGISNLTFTSAIGNAQFGKVKPDKDAKDFMTSLFDGIKIAGGKGKGGSGKSTTPPGSGSVASSATAAVGQTAQQADADMDAADAVLTKAGVPNAIVGTPGVAGDSVSQPWCAQWVATQLSKSNYKPPNSAWADAYRSDKASKLAGTPAWGTKVDAKDAQPDDVIVFDYDNNDEANHVAIVTKNENGIITYVGGNQGGTRNSLTNKVTENTIPVGHKDIMMISRPTELLSTPPTPAISSSRGAAAVAPAVAALPDPSVQRVAQRGMISKAQSGMTGKKEPEWWNIKARVDSWLNNARDNATINGNKFGGNRYREQMEELGMASGGTSSRQRQNQENTRKARQAAAKRKAAEASAQRSRLGVQKVDGRWVNMGVSDQAVGSNPWWRVWGKKEATAERKAKQEALAKNLAARLNKEQGIKPYKPKPAPRKPPETGGGTRPRADSSSSSSSTAVVMPPAQPSGASATAEGSFGSAIPSAKTSAMIFADFLYPDLV